jgi:antitoxin CptB
MEEDNNKNFIDHENRLQWACRRGMLELDVLLGNFLKEVYPQLPSVEKKWFVELLDHSDPELFAWLMGHETPKEPGPVKITEEIRRHARSRI